MLCKTLVYALACASLARAQNPSPTAIPTSVAPAAETVAADSPDAAVPLFDTETVQLTDNVIAQLTEDPETAEFASLFAFEDSPETTASRRMKRSRRFLNCKTAPGDFLYPSKLAMGIFNLLLGGAIEPIIPIASVCYPKSEYNNYDAQKCAELVENWGVEKVHYEDAGSLMNPLYQGGTCVQTVNATAQDTCTQGGTSKWAVKVRNVAQIQLAVNFARTLNMRLVVRNTGHDYNGRSTGLGAMNIWTHFLKGIQYVQNYKSADYSGPVFKVAAGVQGFELYQAAEKYGVSAVAGICPSVGVYGGYSTGGGHSPLMQLFGTGADQVVAMEVVTASGRFVTATPSVNSDLYWAMLGGGGGTFGIITSAVVKVHKKMPVTVSTWSFMTSETVNETAFWEAVRFFWDSFPKYNAAKTYSYFSIMKLAPTQYMFSMNPFWAPDQTVEQYEELIAPFYNKLKELGISISPNTTTYPTVYQAYQTTFGTLNFYVGGSGSTPGNRLIPKTNWDSQESNDETFAAIKNAVDKALMLNIYHQSPNNPAKIVNSVNPAFRGEGAMVIVINMVTDLSPAGLSAAIEDMTTNIMGPLRAATPNGGTYGNEADIAEPNWQKSFWGDNYARLLSIKKKWDPTDLFYVHHGVGSEAWVVDDGERGVQTQDGKLCRA